MTKNEFIENVKVGTIIKDGDGALWQCTKADNGFIYSFKDNLPRANVMSFIGITDASVEEYAVFEGVRVYPSEIQ